MGEIKTERKGVICLKFICEYREFDDIDHLPSVKENVSDIPHGNKGKILKHLKSGKSIFATSTPIVDIFTGKPANIELCTYTDGNFTWTSEEIYYFEKYNLKLNDEFINSVQ